MSSLKTVIPAKAGIQGRASHFTKHNPIATDMDSRLRWNDDPSVCAQT